MYDVTDDLNPLIKENVTCVETFQKAHPEIELYVASLDEKLDKNAYILPGLGDAGDRVFGTK